MNEQPIGRYIAIALIFVLLFVGVAYLAYRFSRQSTDGTPTFPVTSPTPTVPVSTGGSGGVPAALIPAPIQQPINPYVSPGRIFASPAPITTTILSNIKDQAPAFVAYDGKGNLLINNLTHDEFYQLERLKLENAQALALARENNSAQVAQSRSQQETQQKQAQATLEAQKLATQRERDQQIAQLQNQRENQSQQYQLEQARLRQQIDLERVRATTQRQSQPSVEDQIRLILAQGQQQAYVSERQATADRLRTQAENDGQYRLRQLEEQGETARRAHELALQRSDRTYQLIASQTQADVQRSMQSQQYQQQRENTLLQARIQENMLKLQAYLGRYQQPYSQSYGQSYGRTYQPFITL